MVGVRNEEAGGYFWQLVWLSPLAAWSMSVPALCPDGRFSGALGTGQNVSVVGFSLEAVCDQLRDRQTGPCSRCKIRRLDTGMEHISVFFLAELLFLSYSFLLCLLYAVSIHLLS